MKSWKKLAALVKKAPDLTQEGVFSPERIERMVASGKGLSLLYGAEKVSPPILQALFELAEERDVIAKMLSMQAGKKVNFIEGVECENRAALHTAMRGMFTPSSLSEEGKKAILLAQQELNKLEKLLPQWASFTDLIQIGIGGSSLGPEAVALGLERYQVVGRRVHFLSNVDPDEMAKILKKVELSRTLIVVVSKSGTTTETVTNERVIRKRLLERGLDPKEHLIAVTGEKSLMDNPSLYRASFYIWDYVGGRYSVTSMVGGVLLSFLLGFSSFLEFLRGAHEIDLMARTSNVEENLPLLAALLGVWNRNFLGYSTFGVIPYSQALSRFPAHLQQLSMESNGKGIDQQGCLLKEETAPVLWGEVGTNGQHSFFQLLHQGTTIVPLELIGFAENQYGEDVILEGTSSQQKLLANLFAQSIALARGQKSFNLNKNFFGNRPNRILFARRLDPYTMGALIAYYEHQIVFQGFLWGINSFDQEGVQLGKNLSIEMARLLAGEQSSFPCGEAYLRAISKGIS